MGTHHVLCVLEIDEFRAIVEKCGRKAGKGLLRKLARVLDKHVGSKGTIGRLTKGRFAMLLKGCDLEDGRAIAERQRKSMEKSRCVWQEESFQLTISIGMVSLDGHNRATVSELIKAAGAAVTAPASPGSGSSSSTAPRVLGTGVFFHPDCGNLV